VEVMPNYRPEALANRFLELAGSQGLTQLQIQKLVYIAHGWTLAITGEPLTSTEPEAWDRGPVYRDLRSKISHIGSNRLTRRIHENDDNPFAVFASENRGREITANLNETEEEIISLVWNRYGHLHGFTLSDLTHEPNTPWHNVYHRRGRNAAISNDEIEEHYSALAKSLQEDADQAV
jgi:uncharacterized phage-associated protein